MSTLVNQRAPMRLTHFTPLRYPGGKSKLAAYVKALLTANDLLDGLYVEPYCGGAGIALELLLHEYVSRIHINDVSELVHAFWWSVLNDTNSLCRLVFDTPRTVDSWDKNKLILMNVGDYSKLEVGFATFFLNRTNRSGILNGGIIGGRDQVGAWKIDARYNAGELVTRIESIARMKDRIELSKIDAVKLIMRGCEQWPEKTLVYLDPPYYEKGRDLYYDFYKHDDHAAVSDIVQQNLVKQSWIVSYDNVDPILNLYAARRRAIYNIGYSARQPKQGSEVIFFSDNLRIPPLTGPVVATEEPSYAMSKIC